ncbi:MAG: efflux RND transporter periplasmic adaptor subunit [Methyloligellaceae bacterium]
MPVRGKTAKRRAAKAKPAPAPKLRGPRRSYLWAAVFTLLIAGWMLSGDLLGNSDPGVRPPEEATSAETKARQTPPFRVRVKVSRAQMRDAALTLRGRTEAYARVNLQAETAGVVEALPIDKGAQVKKGSLVCKIETGVRGAMLKKAGAEERQAELDYEAAERLMRQGHTAKLRVAELQARLDAARAAREQAELDLARTRIRAPFDGVLEAQPAKVGDFLAIGETCVTMVDLDPLKLVASVSEREVGLLRTGMKGTATLATGESVSGPIRFIASAADEKTRTFRIELDIDNPQGTLRDGVTATISIPIATDKAHKLPPSVLTLNDEGDVGVRVIEGTDRVRFMPVRILSDSSEGVWAAGLPETVTIITVGQDYVRDGQRVVAVPAGNGGSARQ